MANQEMAMQSGINRDGFTPQDLAKDEREEMVEEGLMPFPDAVLPDASDAALDDDLQQINHLRRQVSLLKSQLADIAERKASQLQVQAKALDADAHFQLGDYPWVKLGAVFTIVFFVTRAFRSL
jgi:hypothetical protein